MNTETENNTTNPQPDLPPMPPPNKKAEAKDVVIFPNRPQPHRASTALPAAESSIPNQAEVRVTPNLLHLVSGLSTTAEEQKAVRKQRDLNEIIHQMLIIGLVASTLLMLTGLGLDLALGREMPTTVPDFTETFRRVAAMRPSGFLTLGMLVLIATPILRVVGSVAAFIYERDWRYAGVTVLVLFNVVVSLISGKG